MGATGQGGTQIRRTGLSIVAVQQRDGCLARPAFALLAHRAGISVITRSRQWERIATNRWRAGIGSTGLPIVADHLYASGFAHSASAKVPQSAGISVITGQ